MENIKEEKIEATEKKSECKKYHIRVKKNREVSKID